MNITPQRSDKNMPEAPTPSVDRKNRTFMTNKYLSVISVVLAVCLVFSVLLNIALLISWKSSPAGNVPASDSAGSSQSMSSSKTEGTSSINTADTATETPTEPEIDRDILLEMVESYADAAQGGFTEQAHIYDKLLELLKIDNRPIHVHKSEDENVQITEPLKTPAQVAFAYVDLTTGYTFSYNGDEPLYAASLTKAPYLLALLKEVDEFENNKRNFAADGTPLYDANGNALFEGDHPNLDEDGNIIYLPGEEKYDLSSKWVYDSNTMYVKGSGYIQDRGDGFTLTYLELIEYALKYSDNIAQNALIRRFGDSFAKEFEEELGLEGPSAGFMKLTANDCIAFIKEVYEFTESDSYYGAIMKNAMLTSIHGLMIPSAVSPIKCAHKYGWDIDAYHDLGIVYHERPFAVVVMTDLDNGTYEDNSYIQSIVKAILELHESFTPSDKDGTN